jgi:hypothetical protein
MAETTKSSGAQSDKQPLDVDRALSLIDAAVRPYPKAAMFELAEQGYSTPFEQLIACIISIRTWRGVAAHRPAAVGTGAQPAGSG